jgi:hypothetical protein
MKIPINTEKKLADGVIETIRQKLISLNYISEIFPAAKIGKRENGSTYPAVYMQDGNQKILDLTPNSEYKSYVFFEKRDYNISTFETDLNAYNLSLIFWGQMNLIDATKKYDYTDEIVSEIIKKLRFLGGGNFTVIFENVFEKYNLHKSLKQFFMYPFNSFKINFQIFSRTC